MFIYNIRQMNIRTTHILFHKPDFFLSILIAVLCLLSVNTMVAQCFGGQVFSNSATNSVSICPSDAESEGLGFFNTSNASTDYAYVTTDLNNNVLSISTSNTLHFENLIEGNYLVYGFSYSGEIRANVGDNVYLTNFASICWQISLNRVEVQLVNPLANEIRTSDFQTEKNICLNEGAPDFVSFQNISKRNAPFVFLVTDTNGSILSVQSGDFIDFSNGGFGDCYVYGLAFTGDLLANFGMNVNTANLATGCFELSDNFVKVNRSLVNGGNVFTQDFLSECNFITDDGIENTLNFTNSGSVGAEYVYILTNGSNSIIEYLDEPTFNFEGLTQGTYRIWGYSFSGELQLNEGQSIFNTPFSDGCFRLSANAITITAVTNGIVVPPVPCTLLGTQINPLNETTFCSNLPEQILITDAIVNLGVETALLVVDQNETIVQIELDEEVSTQALLPGVYNVLQIVHENLEDLIIGQSLTDLEGCFALSNRIEITKLSQDNAACFEPAVCSLEPGDIFASTNSVCIEDPEADPVFFTVVNNSSEGLSGILITNTNGVIEELSANTVFNITSLGIKQYYFINYIDSVQIFAGLSIQDLEGCFTLSSPVSIVGVDDCFMETCEIEAAEIFTAGATFLCAADESDDNVTITSVGGTGDVKLFLLTDENQNILQANPNGNFDISDDLIGVFEIYKLDIDGTIGFPESISSLEGCFALSEPIVIENSLDNCVIEPPLLCQNGGGQIFYDGPAGICGSDGQNDILDVEVLSQGASNTLFLVVDEAGRIVNIAPALVILSNPFPAGNYNIYLLSYEDFPTEVMFNANINAIEGLCLSNNISILVSDDFCEGEGVRGGLVSNEFDEDDIQFCTNIAGEVFTLNLETTGSEAFEYIYVETDENNIITDILNGESAMYIGDPTEMMNRRIWGVSFSGMFTAFVGEEITTVSLSDGEFSLSENFIQIGISVVIAEDPLIDGAEAPFLEIPAGQIFSIDFDTPMSAFLDYETAYVLFDTNGVTIIDVLFPDANFVITLPELEATPLSGELLQLTAVSYTGTFLLGPGDMADSAFLPLATNVTTGCFEVANTNISIRVFDAGDNGLVIPLGEEIGFISKEEISLRPNPVQDELTVTFPSSFIGEELNLNIYDTSGKLVFKKKFSSAPKSEKINVSRYSKGNYVLQAYTNLSAHTAQFLKI